MLIFAPLLSHMQPLIRFSLRMLAFAGIFVAAAVVLQQMAPAWLHNHWLVLLISALAINIGCYAVAQVVVKKFDNDPQAATFGLLAALSAHFILYLFLLLTYYLVQGKFSPLFAGSLLVFYSSFLVFEVVSLLNILRPLSNEHK